MIHVQNVCYRYPGNRADTLQDISFSVNRGEIFGFLGPSGAGKSTLQKILTGTLGHYRGSAEVMGTALNRHTSSYYERIGVDFEFPNFYGKFTAMENLRYFASLYIGPLQNPAPLLARVGLLEDADKRVSGFSKGMKTRLGFIRCLLHQPDLLFLDEPTSGLDPANARIVKQMIQEQRQAGKTVILTTHNMHDAEELCDRVAFIVDGGIRALDTPAVLRTAQQEPEVTFACHRQGRVHEKTILLAALGQDADFRMAAADGTLVRIHSKEPTLEDVFITLTGRRLQ